MKNEELIEKINYLKKEKNAIILVHNYQRPEIYDIADYIGDSYGLSVEASKTDADIIVFCGVDFMAESAYILNPNKKVLLPAPTARCPMAAMADEEQVKAIREKYPNAAIVSYMNTTAETKAESDVIVTSSNAVKIVNNLPQDQIVFLPDRNLASYVAEHTDKEIIPWDGFCYVHNKFQYDALKEAKETLPEAKVIAHPECTKEVRSLADHICSTSGMVDYAKANDAKEFIIATEVGMLTMLEREVPDKKFYAAPPGGTCVNMKKNSLELVLKVLQNEDHIVTVPEKTAKKAKKALDKMLEVAK